jgi:hypothetical protein
MKFPENEMYPETLSSGLLPQILITNISLLYPIQSLHIKECFSHENDSLARAFPEKGWVDVSLYIFFLGLHWIFRVSTDIFENGRYTGVSCLSVCLSVCLLSVCKSREYVCMYNGR